MSSFPRYHQDIVDNPVQRHERDHLRRERISWFSRGLYLITIFVVIYPFFIGVIELLLPFLETASLEYVIRDCFIFLVMLNCLAIFTFEMRIISDSADSMRREFQGKTWELLILTGVDTWRMIIGKWLGVIRGHRRNLIYLYVLRMVTFVWGMVFHYLTIDGFTPWRFDNPDATLFNLRLDLSILATTAIILAIYLVLEVMLAASLPMALSMFKPSRKGAPWLALGLRIIIPIGLIGLVILIRDLPYILHHANRWDYQIPAVIRVGTDSIALALVDNGFFLATSQLSYFSHADVFAVMQLLGIGLYVLWIWIMLSIAKWTAQRMNVSAPGFEPKIKPKHPEHHKMQITMPATMNPSPVRTVPKVKVYRCEVLRYDRDNAQLHIAIYPQGETSPLETIQFTGVSYFTGMMRWRTTDFSITQGGNLESFTNQHHIDYNRLSADSKLYEMQSMDSPVYVIATTVQKVMNK